jgi:DNA polymerase-3 subunit chi
LDEALWTFTAQSFVAHCWSSDASLKTELSPVILKSLDNPSDDSVMPHHEILLNLGHDMPQDYETFERVIEVVGLNEEDKAQARERWKQYAQRGYTLVKHDLSSKAATP